MSNLTHTDSYSNASNQSGEESLRMGTMVTYKGRSFLDTSYIEKVKKDPLLFEATSLTTGKSEAADSFRDAYINHIIGIALAFRYKIDHQDKAQIGIMASDKEWKMVKKLHRLSVDTQKKYLDVAKRELFENILPTKRDIIRIDDYMKIERLCLEDTDPLVFSLPGHDLEDSAIIRRCG